MSALCAIDAPSLVRRSVLHSIIPIPRTHPLAVREKAPKDRSTRPRLWKRSGADPIQHPEASVPRSRRFWGESVIWLADTKVSRPSTITAGRHKRRDASAQAGDQFARRH